MFSKRKLICLVLSTILVFSMAQITVYADNPEDNIAINGNEAFASDNDRTEINNQGTNNSVQDNETQIINEEISEKINANTVKGKGEKGDFEEELDSFLNDANEQKDLDNGDVIEVRTEEDLNNIRNNLSANYQLMNDIDITEETGEGGIYNTNGRGWVPIGSDLDNPFRGTIDGNGFSIIGTNSRYIGGVGGVIGYNSGTIKNLKCSNGLIVCANNNTGGIVGENNSSGIIEDCENANAVSLESNNSLKEFYIGGVVGSNHGTVDGCINTGIFEQEGSNLGSNADPYIGGVAGYNDHVIANSVNNKAINLTIYNGCTLGGIVGTSKNGLIGGTTNNAEINCLSGKRASLGGICGTSTRDSIIKSKNTSIANLKLDLYSVDSYTTSGTYYVGGICANAFLSTISECINGGSITNEAESTNPNYEREYHSGGIVGWTSGDVYFSINSGIITLNNNLGSSVIGGIAGYTNKEISNCSNIGNLTINNSGTENGLSFGGIAGDTMDNAFIFRCSNDGMISVKSKVFSHVGGLVGKLRGNPNITDAHSMLDECFNVGDIYQEKAESSTSGTPYYIGMGGLVGTIMNASIIFDSYNAGQVCCSTQVTTWNSLGGIAGYCKDGRIMNVYNVGKVSRNSALGGAILGYLENGNLYPNCIGGNWTANSVIRQVSSNYSNVNETVRQYYYMKSQDTYSNFDFESTWMMSDGDYDFPILRQCDDVDYQRELILPIKLINSSDADVWVEGYTGDVVDKQSGEVLVRGTSISMLKKSVANAVISGISNKRYTGGYIYQNISVEVDGLRLNYGEDYYLVYSNNVNPGKATITVRGTGKYEGVASRSFQIINPEIIDLPSVKISKPKAAKKSATVKWKKVNKKNQKKIGNIQIQYSSNRSFSANVITVTAKKSAKSKKIKKLASKQTYYVRIRAYKNNGGIVHVSNWSAVKSVKAK